MTENANTVYVVVDRHFGARLRSLVGTGSVWLIDTEENQKAVTDYEAEKRTPIREDSVTRFKYLVDDTASESCLNILDVLDLHEYYSGGYSVLEVIGVPRIGRGVRAKLKELGFTNFYKTAEGFRASRRPL